MKCGACGHRWGGRSVVGDVCGIRISGEARCVSLLEADPVQGAERKLSEHFGAQVSKGVDADALRELAPGRLAAFTIGTAGGLGVRFAFDLLGAILLRATDEELAALFRPTRGGR